MSRIEHGGNVFLIAPAGAEVEPILGLCSKYGLKVRRLDDISFGASMKDQLATAMASSDLVIAFFGRESATANVAYQVGIAHGLNKPTLLVAHPSAQLPSGLLGHPIALTSEAEFDAAEFWLHQLLYAPPREATSWPEPPRSSPEPGSSRDWTELADEVVRAWRSRHHSQVEAMVGETLREARVDLLAQPEYGGRRPDFAAWVDELEGVLGNPFLIELKGSLRGGADQRRAFHQVGDHLSESNSRWALVLFMDGPGQPFGMRTEDGRLVLFQRFDEFARGLSEDSFVNTMKQLRNETVHSSTEQW